jgi:hypothetical protein
MTEDRGGRDEKVRDDGIRNWECGMRKIKAESERWKDGR